MWEWVMRHAVHAVIPWRVYPGRPHGHVSTGCGYAQRATVCLVCSMLRESSRWVVVGFRRETPGSVGLRPALKAAACLRRVYLPGVWPGSRGQMYRGGGRAGGSAASIVGRAVPCAAGASADGSAVGGALGRFARRVLGSFAPGGLSCCEASAWLRVSPWLCHMVAPSRTLARATTFWTRVASAWERPSSGKPCMSLGSMAPV